jgi:hypothetical protein
LVYGLGQARKVRHGLGQCQEAPSRINDLFSNKSSV